MNNQPLTIEPLPLYYTFLTEPLAFLIFKTVGTLCKALSIHTAKKWCVKKDAKVLF